MDFISSSFSNLTFSIKKSGLQLGANIALNAANYRQRDGKLVFISPRGYENVYVYAAKRTMMQLSFAQINDLYPKYLRQLDIDNAEKAYNNNQGKELQNVIINGKDADSKMSNKQSVIIKYKGKPANEALVLWVQNDNNTTAVNIRYNTYWDKIKMLSGSPNGHAGKKRTKNGILEDTQLQVPVVDEDHVFLDLGAIVSVQGGNNVIQTKVQGRDCTRKELVSGNDLVFTVKGKIVSNFPDVYPYEEVSRFIILMQHKGVLHVHNILFQQLNVTQIIIKDFNLGQIEGFKNEQPYSFTCVAIEVDKSVERIKDTLNTANVIIQESNERGWKKPILDNIKKAAANQAAQMLEQLTSNVI